MSSRRRLSHPCLNLFTIMAVRLAVIARIAPSFPRAFCARSPPWIRIRGFMVWHSEILMYIIHKLRETQSAYLWSTGDIDKATSEDLLHLANVGSFLVRRKLSSRADSDTLTLSLKADKDAVRHIRILHDAGGYSVSKNVHFASVEKLIHFYARNQGGNFPRLQRGLVRDTAADDAPNPIFEYVNLVAEAKGSAVTPTVCLGSGFGQCGFYQRRWLLSLQGNSYK
eukprot:m.90327 g.90327  ORF g.90327 m.90327 type:complete len:225 (-) comp11837_c0_seq2:129-803(-)